MSYRTSLLAKLKDADFGWPCFEAPDFLDVLDGVAEDAFKKNSVEGHLAALLIWHQLSEEMAKLLLRDAQFLIQLAIYPAEITFQDKKNQMFGSLLDELSATVSFEHKEEFLAACRKLNSERIALVHRLTRHSSLTDIMSRVVKVKSIHDDIYRIFGAAHDAFRVNFHSYAKDTFSEELDEFIEDGTETS